VSGIVALFDRNGNPVDRDRLTTMCDRLAHRGPDGGGAWLDEHVGLGHQQLQSTPEAADDTQPGRDRNHVVTADVRLDNRAELLDRLSLSHAGAVPDSRLLLAAYREWGTRCPEHLVGAFAFVIRDADRNRLFCARDHMGVKPLYYASTPARFAAASEPGPLFDLPGVAQQPNESRIGDYLVGRYGDEAETFYEDVARLPPAHSLTVTETDRIRRRYWSLDDVEPIPADANVDFERRFRELFTDAVDARLRSPEPVGSFLSGGLDSSSITSVAGHLREQRGDPPLDTFSAIFEEITACNERPYIDAVLDSGQFTPHFVHGDRVDPLANVDRYLARTMAPYYPSLIMLMLRLYREVERRNPSVVLHGYGGDQTMGSDVRGYVRELARRGELTTLAEELRGYRDLFGLTTWEVLLEEVLKPLAPRLIRQLRHRFFDEDHYLDTGFVAVDREFARRTGLLDRLVADGVSRPPQSQRALVRRSLTNGEPTFNLELNDAIAAEHGVEPRYPYFDKRLVEFAVAIPPSVNVSGGLDRVLVRKALEGLLPPAVRNRTDKMDFSRNVTHGVREYALEKVESTLFDGPTRVGEYVGCENLHTSFDRLERNGDVFDARSLLMATTLERWLRDHTVANPK